MYIQAIPGTKTCYLRGASFSCSGTHQRLDQLNLHQSYGIQSSSLNIAARGDRRGGPHCQSTSDDPSCWTGCWTGQLPVATNGLRVRIRVLTESRQVITKCSSPGQLALAYDDGPYQYTQKLVDTLTAGGAKGTFFVTGTLYGMASSMAATTRQSLAPSFPLSNPKTNRLHLRTQNRAPERVQGRAPNRLAHLDPSTEFWIPVSCRPNLADAEG